MSDINKVFSILEVNQDMANRLLDTGNCIPLIAGRNESKDEDDNTIQTEFIYSIGQVEYGEHKDMKDILYFQDEDGNLLYQDESGATGDLRNIL